MEMFLENLWISMVFLGVAINAIQPLAMEMWADAAYPIDEGTATSVPVWLNMLVIVIYLSTLSRLKGYIKRISSCNYLVFTCLVSNTSDQTIAFYIMVGLFTTALPFMILSLKSVGTRMQVDLKQN